MRHLVVIAALACAGCETYAVHRAALVPRATPIPTSGQPNVSTGDVSLGATALDPTAPRAGDPEIGVEEPGVEVRGAIALRVTENFSLGAFHERGLAGTARALHDTQPPVDGGDVAGTGLSIQYSAPLDDRWRLGISFEAMVWSVPYVEYVTCTTCDQPYTDVNRGNATVPAIAGALTPSYKSGSIVWFGGLTFRNHPIAAEKSVQNFTGDNGGVDTGPGVAILDVGAEIALGDGVRASLSIAQVLDAMPVAYGPSFGAAITIPLGTPTR